MLSISQICPGIVVPDHSRRSYVLDVFVIVIIQQNLRRDKSGNSKTIGVSRPTQIITDVGSIPLSFPHATLNSEGKDRS